MIRAILDALVLCYFNLRVRWADHRARREPFYYLDQFAEWTASSKAGKFDARAERRSLT